MPFPAHRLHAANDAAIPDRPAHAAACLQVVALGGYGIWLWIGLSLLLGVNQHTRSGILMPVALGAVLVGSAPLAAALHLPGLARWRGWQPGSGRPTRSALIALATWLPMLAIVGLVHADNRFWATRLAGALLALCSLLSVLAATHDDRARLAPSLQRATALLPTCRITAAAFTGGLWLWLCALVQAQVGDVHLWALSLLVLALGLGLLDSGLWQALHEFETLACPTRRRRNSARLAATLLAYVLPCAALLAADTGLALLGAALAVPACVAGRVLDRHLYENALRDARVAVSQ